MTDKILFLYMSHIPHKTCLGKPWNDIAKVLKCFKIGSSTSLSPDLQTEYGSWLTLAYFTEEKCTFSVFVWVWKVERLMALTGLSRWIRFLLTRSFPQTGSEWQGVTELPQSTASHGSKQTEMANTTHMPSTLECTWPTEQHSTQDYGVTHHTKTRSDETNAMLMTIPLCQFTGNKVQTHNT